MTKVHKLFKDVGIQKKVFRYLTAQLTKVIDLNTGHISKCFPLEGGTSVQKCQSSCRSVQKEVKSRYILKSYQKFSIFS